MTKNVSGILSLLSRYICDNQIALTQYIYTANEKHKALKEFWTAVKPQEPATGSIPQDIKNKVSELLVNLDQHLVVGFGSIFEKTYGYLLKFFDDRSSLPVRMTVKVIENSKVTTFLKIPDLFVDADRGELSDNSAFREIAEGAKLYFCNDIPLEIKKDNYVNNRIDMEKARKWVQDRRDLEDEYDTSWAGCWNPVLSIDSLTKVPAPPQTCYKSTIVMPVSLPTNQLTERFKDHFDISDSSERAIFGFVCLDHGKVGYFDKSTDIDFASIVTDIMSLYLIQLMNFTQYSLVYRSAKSLSSKVI